MGCPSIVVDTNVWLGNYVPMRAGHESCRHFLQAASEGGAQLLYPAPILKDVFYLVGMEFKRQVRAEKGGVDEHDAAIVRRLAWGCVDNLCELATAVGMDGSDVWLARKYRALHGDFEDNFVLAAAERADADFLVTSDRRLLRKATVAALSPKDLLALLRAE